MNIEADYKVIGDDENTNCDPVKMYSPNQVFLSVFLGGTLGFLYLIYKNFESLNNENGKLKTILFGSAITYIITVSNLFNSGRIFAIMTAVLFIFVSIYVTNNFQMNKRAIESSSDFDFHSNFRVIFLSLFFMLISGILTVGPFLTMLSLGMIK
ncbi:hypothetical protein BCU30_011290 [Vibrio lentus]|uniref:hypothetical protein n=1 Tax=Vibrio lentus TaxID=136468 RepID=UPI000C81FB71|nr:hypothetical protein [Vibrio lentus]PMG24997.1 hypothetical protein BCU96_05885 [Vibrio lentus]PMH09190.1 hypothetical protein BCU76_07525 [Vibrio lentus]PMI42450.1 hypothetical protein BCU45_18190 [Vibrio lentus]PMI65075.1 hypothetical protein BCU40_19205 [Vibrio lentus]PMJ15003.1 hypothetical protein BCU30_03970 [Vibrio lentus]